MRESALRSQWFSIDNDRVVFELRDPERILSPREDDTAVTIADIDDTVLNIGEARAAEFENLREAYAHRGIDLDPKDAVKLFRDVYELSKITIEGVADKSRYTLLVNLRLATLVAHEMEKSTGTLQERELLARRKAKEAADEIILKAAREEDSFMYSYEIGVGKDINPDIFDAFEKAPFLYKDLLNDPLFNGVEPVFWSTRRTIGGYRGQIVKASEDERIQHVTGVFYSNGSKGEKQTLWFLLLFHHSKMLDIE